MCKLHLNKSIYTGSPFLGGGLEDQIFTLARHALEPFLVLCIFQIGS
jgi:hypothetical protein